MYQQHLARIRPDVRAEACRMRAVEHRQPFNHLGTAYRSCPRDRSAPVMADDVCALAAQRPD